MRQTAIARFRAEPFLAAGCALGECPIWDPEGGRLIWVDIARAQICTAPEAGGSVTRHDMAVTVSAVVARRGGGFMAATSRGFARLDFEDGRPVLSLPGPGPDLPEGWRLNDAACDRQGRLWSGSLAPAPGEGAPRGQLFALALDGTITGQGGALRVQNGLAWSPDGRRMYLSDSHPSVARIELYDFDPETGARSNGRLLAGLAQLGGRPDGAAMDVDGGYWIAASDGGRILRLAPDGRIDAEIEVGVPNPTNLCFTGRDRRSVIITTLHKNGQGGDLYAAHLPFEGLPDPAWG